ncbi:MAG: TRASH domain-containing protein [Candidatus Omnitrophica bacterium]|nr:TRASH domain-containing protein [Candidatus Omnitrophota bacterium]
MNNPVTEATAVKVEYKGKVYNVCCNNCKAAFLKDPEAAIKKFVEVASPAKM